MKKKLALFTTCAALMAAGCAEVPKRSTAGKEKVKEVRLLHLGDMHAQLETHWEFLPEAPGSLKKMGGFARIKTALDQYRKSAPGAVFSVDGGDTFQGSALAAWTQGKAILGPLNGLEIDVGIPGNWEVVYGPEVFRDLMEKVNYKVIAYNFEDKSSGKRLFAPSIVMEQAGVKVAFIGQTDITTTVRQPPAQVIGLDSTKTNGLRQYIAHLKIEENPDLVVLVDHNGLTPMVQLAKEIPEIDVILSNHTHERVYKPIYVGNTIIVEPGSMGSFMGLLDLKIVNKKVVDAKYDFIQILEEKFPEDTKVKELVEKEVKPFKSRLNEVVGHTKNRILRYDVLESNMDNLVADATREATNTDISFTNGFRFSPPIAPGPIKEEDLWNILPLDANLKVGTVTGQQLWDYLEREMELVFSKNPTKLSGGWGPRPSGLRIRFEAGAKEGSRIKKVFVGDEPLDLKKEYSLGGCERDGEPLEMICRVKEVKNARLVEGTAHSALRNYIKKHSPLNLKRDARVRATDLPDKVWSQYGLLQKMWDLPGNADAVELPVAPEKNLKDFYSHR
ncbi:MAG: bifunctional metallophosphatase/5'-nucleotidase [Bacteriovoracia bacterium]